MKAQRFLLTVVWRGRGLDFGGKMLRHLKDDKKTELAVSRERVKELKERLGI